jgi:hypothetical protein
MIKFKHDEDKEMFYMLHPALIMIFADMAYYAQAQHNVDLVVTETITTPQEDNELKRTSKSHQQGRAIDIRTRDLSAWVVQDILEYINKKPEYSRFHYLSSSGYKRLAYYHIGNAEHIHLAIHSQYAIKY